MAFCERDKVSWEAAPAAQFHSGSSSDQKHRGACRGKRFILREHVPDGFGELASDVDPGDLRATLTAEALYEGHLARAPSRGPQNGRPRPLAGSGTIS